MIHTCGSACSNRVLIRAEDFGAIQERRLPLGDGLIVEVSVARPHWVETAPIDEGTLRVVQDGLIPIFDPNRLLARLIGAASALPPR